MSVNLFDGTKGRYIGERRPLNMYVWRWAVWDGETWRAEKDKEQERAKWKEEAERFYKHEDLRNLWDSHREMAKNKHLEFINGIKQGRSGKLIIVGPVGTGKTFLGRAICKELMAEGLKPLEIKAEYLFSDLDSYSWEERELVQEMPRRSIWFIDDITKGFITERNLSRFKAMLDDFLESGYYGLIITLDKGLDALARQVGEAVYSRLVGGARIITLTGKDIRRSL